MSDPKFYDSSQVFVTLGGRPLQSGRAEGDFVTTAFEADAFTKVVGADGEVAVSRSNDRSATIKLKFMQTSEGHKLLTQLYAAQLASSNGALLDFELRDLTGSLLEHAAKCWIQKAPDSSYGATVGEREWTLGCAELVREVV